MTNSESTSTDAGGMDRGEFFRIKASSVPAFQPLVLRTVLSVAMYFALKWISSRSRKPTTSFPKFQVDVEFSFVETAKLMPNKRKRKETLYALANTKIAHNDNRGLLFIVNVSLPSDAHYPFEIVNHGYCPPVMIGNELDYVMYVAGHEAAHICHYLAMLRWSERRLEIDADECGRRFMRTEEWLDQVSFDDAIRMAEFVKTISGEAV